MSVTFTVHYKDGKKVRHPGEACYVNFFCMPAKEIEKITTELAKPEFQLALTDQQLTTFFTLLKASKIGWYYPQPVEELMKEYSVPNNYSGTLNLALCTIYRYIWEYPWVISGTLFFVNHFPFEQALALAHKYKIGKHNDFVDARNGPWGHGLFDSALISREVVLNWHIRFLNMRRLKAWNKMTSSRRTLVHARLIGLKTEEGYDKFIYNHAEQMKFKKQALPIPPVEMSQEDFIAQLKDILK